MSKREKLVVIREAIAPWMDRHAQGDGKATTYLQRLSAVAGRGDGDLGRKIILNITEGTAPDYETLRLIADYLHVTVPEIDIHDFRKSGYLPEVLVNFIALLGWSPGDDREKMTLAELCELFGVDRVGKKSARFDREKLLSFNTTALEAASMEHKLAAFRDYLSVNEAGPLTGLDDALLERLMKLCAGFRTFSDIVTKCAALFAPDESLEYDPKAVKKWLLKGERPGLKVLEELREALQGLDDWSSENLDAFIRAFAEQRELGLGKVAQPLRVATTGTTISPQISDTLALLGRERTLARIDRALEQIVAS